MNKRILENIYESVLEDFPDTELDEKTLKSATEMAYQIFFEGGV